MPPQSLIRPADFVIPLRATDCLINRGCNELKLLGTFQSTLQ